MLRRHRETLKRLTRTLEEDRPHLARIICPTKEREESPDTTSKPEGKALKTSGVSSEASEGDILLVGTDAFASAQPMEQKERRSRQPEFDPETIGQ